MKEPLNANVTLCKCPSSQGVFGIRIEEREHDWIRTWAFKIEERKAKREGFDKTNMKGAMRPTPKYPGCSYCGVLSVAPCRCGKIFCAQDWTGNLMEMTCPWCGHTDMYYSAETIEIKGGGL